MKINKSMVFQWLKVILPMCLMLFAFLELFKIVSGTNWELVQEKLDHLSNWTIAFILVLPLILVFPMFFYDLFIVKKLSIKVPTFKLMRQSLVINSFSNILGFGGLAGVLLRTHYFKQQHISHTSFFKTIASVTLFYLSGLSLFTWIIPIFYRDFPLFQEKKFLVTAVIIIGLYIPILAAITIIQVIRKKKSRENVLADLGLLSVSVVEWLGAFALVWLLSYLLSIPIGVANLIPLFIVASCVGIVSMIPGGLGSFDLVFLWGIQSLDIPNESVLLLLLFYRLGYYAIPFVVGCILFIGEQVQNLIFKKRSLIHNK